MRLPSSGFNSPVLQVETVHFSSTSPSIYQSPRHIQKNTWTSGTSVGTSHLGTNGPFFPDLNRAYAFALFRFIDRKQLDTHTHTHTHTFFPDVEQRLKLRIPITPEFTAIVSGHGKTKAYLNRFKLIDNPICPCNEGEKSVEHLMYVCNILEPNKSAMIKHKTIRGGTLRPTNNELVSKYLNVFTKFVKSIDFTKLQ